MPMAQYGKKELSAPIFVGPSIATCESRRQFSPNSTSAPITQYGPTRHEAAIFARGSMIAVGCTLAAVVMNSLEVVWDYEKVYSVDPCVGRNSRQFVIKVPRCHHSTRALGNCRPTGRTR